MALTGTSNEQKIWNYLKAAGLNDCGVAGLMGNLNAESGLRPDNLQNSYEKKLGFTDATYTAAVDDGTYTNFSGDAAGYGLAQWTYSTRKAGLLAFAKSEAKSIGDLEMQLDYLMKELKSGYSAVLNTLKNAATVLEASNAVLFKFERPADQGTAVQTKRAAYGQQYYDKYAGNGGTEMSNSSLVTYTKISPNKSARTSSVIDCVIVHCMVAQWTAKQCCDYFAQSSAEASSNYTVGCDGSIGLSVDEKHRAWTSGGKDANGNVIRVNGVSGADFDHRAITIEVASDKTAPYAVTDKAYAALIELLADVCKRNNIKKLLWKGDKTYVGKYTEQNMGAHRWFANKSCPGDYLYNKMGDIAAKVNAKLGVDTAVNTTPTTASELYRVRKAWGDASAQKGAFTSLENAKKCAEKYEGYSVYNSKGEKVYTPESKAEATTAASDTIYTVKSGDTLSGIAKKYGTTYQALAAYNGISNPNVISVGQKIKIPVKGNSAATSTVRKHTVKKGDTLWVLAKKYLGNGSRYKEIMTASGITSSVLRVGQVLTIPEK